MKIKVNDTQYNIEIVGDKVRVNNDKELIVKQLNSDELKINEKLFHLDFTGEGEPSIMIINGMVYAISKESPIHASIKEIKAPIGGRIVKILADVGSVVLKGQVLFVLEAMKMENRLLCPASGKKVKEIKVVKGQSVTTGEVLLVFE
ncbi:MAG TPA: biotin/lipoyl-containing protein [Nitrososphaeraceae archaeon]